jgi:LacI family transcriptional regulator
MVTLSDVAKVAGVSLSTASKALSGTDRVSEQTRERVQEVARRLDFQPNALAQSFARGRSRTIGILTQNAAGTWSEPVLVGAATELGKQEHATLLYDARFDSATLEASIRRLQARRIDGLLVIGDGPHHAMRSLTHAFAVRVAYAFTYTDDDDDVAFLPDNEQMGRLAAEHLLGLGRRRLAHITAHEDVAAQARARGFAAAIARAGLEPVAIRTRGEWRETEGVAMAAQLLEEGVRFDALFCGNDHMARGAERVLRERGFQIPEDVAIVGVDNWEGNVIQNSGPHLTTVDPLLSELGVAAARYLLSDETAHGRQLLDCRLVVGETTTGEVPAATP